MIRVETCVIFGAKNRQLTKSIQFLLKLIIDENPLPAVKNGDSFRCLGRHFNSNMSNNVHKT